MEKLVKMFTINPERILSPNHPEYRRSEMILNQIALGDAGLLPWILYADVIELLKENVDPLRISRAIQAGLRHIENVVDGRWLDFVDGLIDDPTIVRIILPEDTLDI